MAELRHHPDPTDRERVAECARDVSLAREHLRAARGTGARNTEVHPLRADLLSALEAYAAAITRIGAPVPRTLHAEIELYRRLHNRS